MFKPSLCACAWKIWAKLLAESFSTYVVTCVVKRMLVWLAIRSEPFVVEGVAVLARVCQDGFVTPAIWIRWVVRGVW